jgi:serine/threonine protein kinase
MATAGPDRPLNRPIGRDFGPYKIVRRLGVGGMAETFEAVRTGPSGFSQRVCLKVVLPFFRDRQDFRDLFEREARLAAKLRHSNVVGVIDFGQIDGVTYMALELVDGVDLASLLDAQPNGRLSHEYVALVGHELAAALQHAHDPRREGSSGGPEDNAIIHRDLSPSNVLVSQRGEILLTDFGVAKAITGTARQQSAVKGKVPYMSPEQLRADELDGRADLFALGVLLFEALSGQRPFQGEHDPATIMQILDGRHASLRGLTPSAPPELCDAIESLLETDRGDRPHNAGAVLELLDPFVPSPRMRRELGNMASELHALQASRSSEPPISGSEVTDFPSSQPGEGSGVGWTSGSLASDAETALGRPAPEVARRPPSRKGILWALLALVAAIAAITLWPILSGDPQREAPTSPVETAPPAAKETRELAEEVKPTTQSPPEPERSEATVDAASETVSAEEPPLAIPSVRPASLTVVVFPWGDVWINGRRRGTAPLKNISLEPGRYKIGAGRGKPSKTKTIRLREAQRKTVQFDLTK